MGGPLSRRRVFGAAIVLAVLVPSVASAQTDFFNTDAGRPLRIEDANAVEWRAVELQFAPLRLERGGGGRTQVDVEPELAIGLFPRTHFSIGVPLASVPSTAAGASNGAIADTRTLGLAGIHLSVFHQLNVETRIPSFAVKAGVLLPAGPLAPERSYPMLTGIMTRTLPQFGAVRVHANASVTFGEAPTAGPVPRGPVAEEVPRWLAGVSIDRAFPLRFSLLAAEVVARRGLETDGDVMWRAGVGARHQFSPRVVMDAGIGRDLTGARPGWSLTFGSALAVGLGQRRATGGSR